MIRMREIGFEETYRLYEDIYGEGRIVSVNPES